MVQRQYNVKGVSENPQSVALNNSVKEEII